MKDTYFCLAFVHYPGVFHSRTKKIATPDDVKGMKIRPAQATVGAMIKSLGGTNVQASAPEARDAIERGVADGLTLPWGTLVLFGIDKVTKYHMDAPLYTAVFTYSINKSFYASLSDAQKKVIDGHCDTEWAGRVSKPFAEFEKAGQEKLAAEPGQEIYAPTREQLDQWKKVVAPLKEAWAAAVAKTGVDPGAAEHEFVTQLQKEAAN